VLILAIALPCGSRIVPIARPLPSGFGMLVEYLALHAAWLREELLEPKEPYRCGRGRCDRQVVIIGLARTIARPINSVVRASGT